MQVQSGFLDTAATDLHNVGGQIVRAGPERHLGQPHLFLSLTGFLRPENRVLALAVCLSLAEIDSHPRFGEVELL